MQIIVTLSIILIIITEGHATFMRNFTWKTEESLWIDVIDKYPQSFRAHHNLAKYYSDNDQEERAIDGYQKALELGAMHNIVEKGVTAFNLGLIYFLREDLERAESYYLQAIRIDPCCRGAHNNLAVILARTTSDHEEVFKELEKAIICNPESTQAQSNMGLLFLKTGRLDEGIVSFKKALEIEPKNTDALEALGYTYMKKGHFSTAAVYFNRAFNQTPRNIRALLYLAELYTIAGNIKRAQESLSQFADFICARDLRSFLDELLGKESLLQIRPDMTIVFPILAKVYEQRISSLEKNRDFCANH